MQAPIAFDAHESFVLGLAFLPDNRTLVSAGADGLVKLWSVGDWRLLATLAGHAGRVTCLALSPDGRLLASGCDDATARLWSLPEGKHLHTFRNRKRPVSSVALSADNRWVAAAGAGGRATVWEVGGKVVAALAAGKQNLTSVVLAPDGRVAVIAGEGGEISAWSLPDGQRIAAMDSSSVSAGWLHFTAGGSILMSMGFERDVLLWDTATWQRKRAYPMNRLDVYMLAVAPDESLLGLAVPGAVQLRSTSDMELQAELPVDKRLVGAIAFSPDGFWVAVGASDGKVRVWRLRIRIW